MAESRDSTEPWAKRKDGKPTGSKCTTNTDVYAEFGGQERIHP